MKWIRDSLRRFLRGGTISEEAFWRMKREQQALDRKLIASGALSPEDVLLIKPDQVKRAKITWPPRDVSMLDEPLILLFLDFDGVLHPFSPRSDRPAEESVPFAYLARLEAVLLDYPSVQIVIASDWRKHHTIAELRQFFSEDIRFRIAGVLGIDATDHQIGNRQRLFERYLADQSRDNANWIALDDDADNYQIDAPLIRCDDGFCDEEERSLRAALRASLRGEPIPGSRALAAAASLSGDRDRAWTWYRAHGIREFGGLTSEQLVQAGREADVIAYIESIKAGDEVEFQERMSNVRMDPIDLGVELPPDEMTEEELKPLEASPFINPGRRREEDEQ